MCVVGRLGCCFLTEERLGYLDQSRISNTCHNLAHFNSCGIKTVDVKVYDYGGRRIHGDQVPLFI